MILGWVLLSFVSIVLFIAIVNDQSCDVYRHRFMFNLFNNNTTEHLFK